MKATLAKTLYIALACLSISTRSVSQQPDMWITGYYPVWSLGTTNGGTNNPMYPHEMNWKGITHLVHFGVGPDSIPPYWHPSSTYTAGTANVDSLEMFFGWDWRGNTAYCMIDTLRTYARRNGTKLLLSVGGIFGRQARVLDYITSDTLRTEVFADAVIGFVSRNGYDGVEIDYEPPQSQEAMSLLTCIMRGKLTAALGSSAPLVLSVTNLAEDNYDLTLKDSVTQYNFMMYDMHNPYNGIEGAGGIYDVTGYNAPLHLPDTAQYPILGLASLNYDGYRPAEPRTWGPNKFVAMGFPKSKIGVGIPFYGYVFDKANAPNQSSVGINAHYVSYTDVLSFLNNGGTAHWDNTSQVAWAGGMATADLGWVIINGHQTYVTYDDANSVREKVRWAKTNGFGGMMAYELWSGWVASAAQSHKDPLLHELVEEVRNHNPVVNATVTPTSGYAPLAVTVHASGSTDFDGDSLSYTWTFGNGDTSHVADTTYTFATSGIDTLTVKVTDGRGGIGVASFRVVVGQAPLPGSILYPFNPSFFHQGDTVHLQAVAISGGPAVYRWDIDLGYGDNFLNSQQVLLGDTCSFVAHTVVNDGQRYHFRVRLEVTQAGISIFDTTEIYPMLNLHPTSISVTPEFPSADSSFNVKVKIKNIGDAGTALATLKVFEDAVLLASGSMAPIPPDDSLVVTVPANGLPSGAHVLRAVVDAAYELFETNELDNEISRSVTVRPHLITASSGAHGSIYPPGVTDVPSGGDVRFTIVPDSNYRVGAVIVDGISISPDTSYTFAHVAANHTIAATFGIVSYAVNSPGPISVDLDGSGAVDMVMNFSVLQSPGGSVSPRLFPLPPVGILGPDTSSQLSSLPCYIQIASTIPNHQFVADITIDMAGVAGFDSSSVIMYYNSTTSTWVMIPGTYVATNPEWHNHPTFQFSTDHFTTFGFVKPSVPSKDLFVSPLPGNMEFASVYPDSTWRVSSLPPGSYHGPDDWSWTANHPVSVYIVPDVGSKFKSCSLTVEWDNACLSFDTLDFGSAGSPNGLFGSGHSYDVAASFSQPGSNHVTIHCERLDSSNFSVALGDYVVRMDFRVIKPGHSTIAITGADFKGIDSASSLMAVLMAPRNAIVKAYLGDFASSGSTKSGDGLIDFQDLVPWSLAYWSGTPGAGMANYKTKYDIGPTQDGFVFSPPVPDGQIDFEDLFIFSITYGLSNSNQLPKVPAIPSTPITASLGKPQRVGNETRIPLIIRGGVQDVRAMKLEVTGQFGDFVGVDKGALLQRYTSPMMLMHTSRDRTAYVDLAVMGAQNHGVNAEGELAVLRFSGSPHVHLENIEARNSRNILFSMVKKPGEGDTEPTVFALQQNYPNPFNPATIIEYEVPQTTLVQIQVFNVIGERVATLVDETKEPGFYQVEWKGLNDAHLRVASGVYFYRMHAGEFNTVKKLLLLK